MGKIRFLLLAACMAQGAWMAAASGQEKPDPFSQVERGNTSYSQGQFDEALGTYKSVAESLGERPELDFNQAAALYKLGQYEPAGNLFAKAALAKNPVLAQAAKYNRGNCDYATAMKVVEAAQQPPAPEEPQADQPDLNAAVQKLESAIRHYGDALSAAAPPAAEDSVGDKARANIERAQRMIDVIQEMQQQQEQQQNQDQDQDQEQDQEKQDQQEQQQQDQQEKQDEQQKSDQQQSSDEKDEEQQDQQKSDSDENQQEQDEQDGKQGEDEQQEEQQPEPKPEDEPKEDEQQQQQPKPDEQEQKEQQQAQAQPQEGQPAEMSPEQVEPILQAIRDKEKRRREEKIEALRAQQRAVLWDW